MAKLILTDVCAQMASRIQDYLENCDPETLREIYTLCFGSDRLIEDLDKALE